MNCGKTTDGSFDLSVDNLEVTEATILNDLNVEGDASFEEDLKLENKVDMKTVTISASQVVMDYNLNLPPQDGIAGYILTTNGLGDTQWLPGALSGGSVSYIGISPPSGFMTVNGLGSDSTTTNKTFNFELSGVLPVLYGGTGSSTFPIISLTSGVSGVLPVVNGGTGLSSVGSNGQVLTSNGSGIYWNSGVSGMVTGVTASSPLSSSGGTSPNISVSSSTGTGAIVFQNSPVINTPEINSIFFKPLGTNQPFEFKRNEINGIQISGAYFEGNILKPINYGLPRTLIIDSRFYTGPEYIPNNGAIQIRTQLFYEILPGILSFPTGNFLTDYVNNIASGLVQGRRFVRTLSLNDTSGVYTDGHPLKNIPISQFEEYGGGMGLRILDARSWTNNEGRLVIIGSQYAGVYDVTVHTEDFIEFNGVVWSGAPNSVITIKASYPITVLGIPTGNFSEEFIRREPQGDIEILAGGKGVLHSSNDLCVSSNASTALKAWGDLELFAGSPDLLGEYLGPRTPTISLAVPAGILRNIAGSMEFFTTTGGINSAIIGTTAWNSLVDTELFAKVNITLRCFDDMRIATYNDLNVTAANNISIKCTNNTFVNTGLSLIDTFFAKPIGITDGNIRIECNSTFYIPPVLPIPYPFGPIFYEITKFGVGSIFLKSSETGGVFIEGRKTGIILETKSFNAIFNLIPVGNDGIKLLGNSGIVEIKYI